MKNGRFPISKSFFVIFLKINIISARLSEASVSQAKASRMRLRLCDPVVEAILYCRCMCHKNKHSEKNGYYEFNNSCHNL